MPTNTGLLLRSIPRLSISEAFSLFNIPFYFPRKRGEGRLQVKEGAREHYMIQEYIGTSAALIYCNYLHLNAMEKISGYGTVKR